MYNLLVSGLEESWDGEAITYEASRCVHEYTDSDVEEIYGELTKKQIEAIKLLPCIFAYETSCKMAPKFGFIREITKRQGLVKLEYEIVDLDKFLSLKQFKDMWFELDIHDWEYNRTHWAIKNVDLAKELRVFGITIPTPMLPNQIIDITSHQYDVALSFPGESRVFVKEVANELILRRSKNSIFYDNNFKAQLARPELDSVLQSIYRKQSTLNVVFLSGNYQKKKWCGLEWRVIKEILFDQDMKRIMYIKMDDGGVDGVLKTDGYIDGNDHSPKEVAEFILERLEL